jgi:hypothetical protein
MQFRLWQAFNESFGMDIVLILHLNRRSSAAALGPLLGLGDRDPDGLAFVVTLFE